MSDSSATKSPAPAGHHSLLTFFVTDQCAKAIDFYRETLGAEVVTRMDGPDGTIMHAELRLGDSVFQLSDPLPELGLVPPPAEGNAFTMFYWTHDVDAVFERLVAAGATVMSPLDDVFSGDRMGVVRCPFGVRWAVGRHDRDVPAEEIEAAARAWAADQG